MYDTTPTTGSVNSTQSEKRQLAAGWGWHLLPYQI